MPQVRTGMPDPKLDESTFKRRFREQFTDPAFNSLHDELGRLADAAWDGYSNGRKSPHTAKAGAEFADPDFELSVDWLRAREAIKDAQSRHEQKELPCRILIVNGSSRSDHTCPGEMSKSWRLAVIARRVLEEEFRLDVEVLDLARLASEYGRKIYPCKACFSTASALCHWPCSCYPNHSLGQTQDWMNEIYPMWVAAHGIMIVTPVNWYHSSSSVKLMIDRLVCADGGNPDPTSSRGKDAACAKQLELEGWDYPRHLAGRVFSVIVHGDVEGAEGVRRSLTDWLRSMQLVPAGPKAEIDRYIGYWEPYATSHGALDADLEIQQEVENAARVLAEAVIAQAEGRLVAAGQDLPEPRSK